MRKLLAVTASTLVAVVALALPASAGKIPTCDDLKPDNGKVSCDYNKQ